MNLTVRERILFSLLLFSLLMVPAAIPQGSADARRFNPSDPNLQPVERAEENFAGSAFYFIDPGYAIPQNYGELGFDPSADPGKLSPEGLQSALNTSLTDNRDKVASAHLIQPVSFRASLTDNSRALQCLTSAIYYESGMEPDAGQRGVAQVILNRVRHPSYPKTVCGVIFQGSERRTGCQFSYTCDGSLRRKPNSFHWKRSKKVAALALSGKMASPVGTATHYHATYVYPYWAPSLRFLGTIGAHRFYSWKGSAGKASAFSQKYRGGEPLPAPKPRKYNAKYDKGPSLDPITLERAYEAGRRKAQEEAAKSERAAAIAADNARRHALPAPVSRPGIAKAYQAPSYSKEAQSRGGEKAFAGQKLPDVSQIKPEYRNAGTWKAKPGS
ncbi:Cell wall hydrolyses involved in spore germination [hydrothermal vent metagenome]|uniref:Cell wall hydrolyses involved in spore germination n=1 Tax=hydrothermal vent metagenome TaxID=652676 RepID=A0A3B0T800_9ZZZZ